MLAKISQSSPAGSTYVSHSCGVPSVVHLYNRVCEKSTVFRRNISVQTRNVFILQYCLLPV